MRLSGQCLLLEMRGKYLLMTPAAAEGGQEALQVNESFAFLWRQFRGKVDFSVAEVAQALQEQYGLDADEAEAESGKMVDLWRERGLLEV